MLLKYATWIDYCLVLVTALAITNHTELTRTFCSSLRALGYTMSKVRIKSPCTIAMCPAVSLRQCCGDSAWPLFTIYHLGWGTTIGLSRPKRKNSWLRAVFKSPIKAVSQNQIRVYPWEKKQEHETMWNHMKVCIQMKPDPTHTLMQNKCVPNVNGLLMSLSCMPMASSIFKLLFPCGTWSCLERLTYISMSCISKTINLCAHMVVSHNRGLPNNPF